MELVLLVVVFVISSSSVQSAEENVGIPISVSRRPRSDVYFYNNNSVNGVFCDNENHINVTYLVSERRCVTNEDLFSACSATVIPAEPSTNLTAIAALDSTTMSNVISLKEDSGIAKFKFNTTDQPVNSSFCHIDSLEVYRGRKQAIQISHHGFSLCINGTIEINKDELAYSTDELKGELYRMNLSCSSDKLPNSGCTFFKALGKTSIATAKFNCTVPGTQDDFIEECNITTIGSTITSTTSVATATTISAAVPTNTPSEFEYGSTYFFVVVGCGASVVVLLVAISMVCLCVCLFQTPRCNKSHLGEEKQLDLGSQVSPSKCVKNLAYIHLDPEEEGQDSIRDLKPENVYNTPMSPDCTTVINERDGETHTYALLENPQPQQSTNNSPQLYEVPQKTIPKSEKLVNGGLEQQGISNTMFHQHDEHHLNKSPHLMGNSNPSDHTYALPNVQQTQKITNTVNQYDEPLTENISTPHLSEERAIHKYAVLESPQS